MQIQRQWPFCLDTKVILTTFRRMKQYLYDYELNLGVRICLVLGDYIKIIYIEHLIIKLMKISPPSLLNELVPGYVVTYCLGVQAPAFTQKKKKNVDENFIHLNHKLV